MVRKADLYNFFEKNETYDNQTSFIAKYVNSGETANTYSYSNIAPLISKCILEKNNGEASEDWNKVVLVPVKVDKDSQGNIIGIKSNLDMEGTQLKGGKDTPIEMQVLYTTF